MDMKQKIKSIICAVDFSEESMKAVEFAASLVGQNSEATLYLLNVVKPVVINYYPAISVTSRTLPFSFFRRLSR